MSTITLPYRAVTAARNWCFDHGIFQSVMSRSPVVSVGNVSFGGSGKTPFAQYLASMLLARGAAPVILLRGYRGRIVGPAVVREVDSPDDVGDEAVLHYEEFRGRVPVVVARKRVEGARLIDEARLGEVIILDDGFQHRRLARDFDLLLYDPVAAASGNFREALDGALRRADAIIVINRLKADGKPVGEETLPESLQGHPTFHFALQPRCFIELGSTNREYPLDSFRGISGVALSAIANPWGFEAMLTALGIHVVHHERFRDHYRYRDADMNTLRRRASGRPIFTTTKDGVKLSRLFPSSEIFVLKLQGEFRSSEEEENFLHLTERKLGLPIELQQRNRSI